MRVFCTSGTVRGEDGNILTYSGSCMGTGPIKGQLDRRPVWFESDPLRTRGQTRCCSAATDHRLEERDLWDILQTNH
jgi:hypothetical protein